MRSPYENIAHYHVTHVLRVNETPNSMVKIILRFGPRSGQIMVQKGELLKLAHFLLKTYLPCPVLYQDSKDVICFDVGQTKMRKKYIKKRRYHLPLPGFSAIAQPKIKSFGLKNFTTVADA